MHDEALFAERVLRAGARGYIMKHGGDRRALSARSASHRRPYLRERGDGPAVLERLRHEGAVSDNPLGNLTDRELEVFDLIGRGLSTSAIADRLGVSIKTVETYRSNIKTKLI